MTTNFLKYEGFEIVKNLINKFPDMYFYIQGGSAGYLHAIVEKNTEIKLNDVDIVVFSNHNTIYVNNKLVNYIKSNYQNVSLLNIDDINNEKNTIYYVNIGDNISLNFFVNEVEQIPKNMININGINVESLEATIENEKTILENLIEDLNYCVANCEQDIEHYQNKIRRKTEFLNLFSNNP